MSTTLQQHGRSIGSGFSAVRHRQGAACGELVSTADGEEPSNGEEGLSSTQQLGLALAVLVLLIGGAVAAGGL